MKKNNKLVSTATMALTGIVAVTGTQAVAHADANNQSVNPRQQSSVTAKSTDELTTENATSTVASSKTTNQSAYDSAKQSENKKLANLK